MSPSGTGRSPIAHLSHSEHDLVGWGEAPLDLWISALRMFDAHPILGVGYQNLAGQLPAYFAGTYDTALVQFQELSYAHNTLLSILAETGLVGAFLVGALITMGWRRAQSAARSGDWAGESALLALVGIGVCSFPGWAGSAASWQGPQYSRRQPRCLTVRCGSCRWRPRAPVATGFTTR